MGWETDKPLIFITEDDYLIKSLELELTNSEINKILNYLAKISKCKGELFIHPKYNYIEQTDPSDTYIHHFIYKEQHFICRYRTGSFLPYLCKIMIQPTGTDYWTPFDDSWQRKFNKRND